MKVPPADALSVCIQAANIGQAKGSYTLDQAGKLFNYVQTITAAQNALVRGEKVEGKDISTAYEIVRNAIELAQTKGAFTLPDVSKIVSAFETLDEYVAKFNGAGPASTESEIKSVKPSLKGKERAV